ncbi:hypothetical protein [Legionella hackeliae]|uniref:Uncharacterized protein n=1 Tax=Legionella hackeliae TaxID=449 RepID=A0A0A8UUF8_LEGHA|nr:hypothetical protein [Legionella hackeliae]KTD14214.1 hypothetical protein Lhac_0526 [Legionella hackeliae]CEK10424.1 conserved exported protein of unknown function [Legionella hackeliae]STX47159.1 Uncharacterised protein [Legionella hackeliae]
MKIIVPILMCFSMISFASSNNLTEVPVTSVNPNEQLLPSPFPVYIMNNYGVVNHPYPGTTPASLPTDNSYTSAPGCYIACYSHTKGVYPVSPTIYVLGQVRVKGQYQGRICQPDGFANQDISAMSQFKQLCSEKISSCKNIECWAGGDTGGWFGVQI